MTAVSIRLLLLEDNEGDARRVQTALAEHAPGEFAVTRVERLADALVRIQTERFEVVLCDLGLPDSSGLTTVQAIATLSPELPVVVLTKLHDEDLGRDAIQHGAQDYLVKGESGGALIARALHYAIERKRAELALARQKDLYNVLSQTNQAIVRGTTREELFQAVCRIAVEHGHFLFAWIGLIDRNDKRVKPVAQHGEDAGYVKQLDVSVDETVRAGAGSTGRSLRTGRPVVSNDLWDERAPSRNRDAARRAGARAYGAFPIHQGGVVAGVINFYAAEAGFFTEDLIATLEAMAQDLSFALDNFEREAERNRAEGALRHSETRYRSLFENMLNGFAYCRMQYDDHDRPVDFVYLEVNNAFERLTGLKNVVGKPVSEVIPGIRESTPELFDIYGRVATTGVPETFEIHVEPLRHWFSISAYGPEKGHFVAVFDVITARKKADEALRESEERLRAIFEGALDGILVADAQSGKFLAANPAICRMLGHSPGEIARLGIPDIHREQDLPHAMEQFERLRRHEIQLAADIPVMGKDGSVFYADITAAPIRLGGMDCMLGVFRDVTERKQAEAALRESEARYRSVFANSNVTMLLIDPADGRIVDANSAASAYYGWDLPALQGMTVKDINILGPEQVQANLDRVREDQDIHFEFRHRLANGEVRDVEIFSGPVQIGGRKLRLAVIHDVTESKRAQEALRESEARFRSLTEMSSDFYWETDVEHRLTLLSAGGKARGVPALQQGVRIGRRRWEMPYVSPDEAGWQAHRAVLDARQPFRDFAFSRLDTDGTERHILVSGDPVFDAAGAFRGYRGVGTDITERKRAEETQAKLAAIVESSNDAIIGRALDGTVTSWNAAAERILGYTAAETIGRDPVEIVPPRLRQQLVQNRKLIWAGQMVASHETVRIAKDGRHINFAVSVSAIKDHSGRVIGTATTLRDITERKRTEQALHDNAKRLRGLSRRLIAIEETARRNINRELHDRVGQNLAALNINLNIIRSQLPQQSRDAVGARLQDTQTLLEGMAAQVRDVMADLHPPALDDYGLLAALHSYVESLGARFAVPITVHGEDLAPRLPLVAETALFRIAQGALANAAAHARATRVQVVLAATPDRVTLTIADDGAGFDVAHAALAHASWGLAIMRERAEAVGAALRIDTAPGRGTRVVVEIEPEAA